VGKSTLSSGLAERPGGPQATLSLVEQGALGSPRARRLTRPRWRDHRLLIGVLLVVSCIVIGARVVAAADRSRSWVSVRTDLPAGHVLTAADLTSTSGRLITSAAGHYFESDVAARLVGQELARPVAAGELLGRGAIGSGARRPSRVVPLVVKAGRLPQLREGDRVDIYVLSRASDGAASGGKEVRVAAGAEFLDQQELSAGSGISMQVRVAASAAAPLVAASQSERIDVVRVDPGATGEFGDPGATTTPGFGT
jgi:hypothetical protein